MHILVVAFSSVSEYESRLHLLVIVSRICQMSDLIAMAAMLTLGAVGICMTKRVAPIKKVRGGARTLPIESAGILHKVAHWQATHPLRPFEEAV
jgi:hypothetical protein